MKHFFLTFLVISFSILLAYSQKRIILTHRGCAFSKKISQSELYSWDASNQALEYVREICDVIGIKQNFIVKRANIENAFSTINDNNNRVIYYSEDFFGSLHNETFKKAILAHEIGHQLNNDLFSKDERRADEELAADEFAGAVLCKLKLKLSDAKELVTTQCPIQGEGYYPPRSARIEAFAIGYQKEKEREANIRIGGIDKPSSSTTDGKRSNGNSSNIFINDMSLVAVSAGAFRMGTNSTNPHEGPMHNVTISKDFYISKYECTISQFRKFVEATGYITTAERNGGSYIYSNNGERHKQIGIDWQYDAFGIKVINDTEAQPVINVSWDDAIKYCEWLSSETGKNYRLPTEAEWEFAAKGGNKTSGYYFSGSNNSDDVGWNMSNTNKPRTVGLKKPNELGIYDMSGNLYEWCNDWFGDNYYSYSLNKDPQGPESGTFRVIRGGCWKTYAGDGAVFARGGRYHDQGDCLVGFRVVLVP